MKYKVLIGLTILLLLMSVVMAKEVDEFKVPMEYSKKVFDGTYQVPDATDTPTFIILKVNDTDEYIHNDTGYTISPTGETKDTYYYVDTDLGEQGCVELVEVDGEKFLIFSQYSNGVKNTGYLGACLLSIQDFNKDNNLEPIQML